MPSLMDAAQAEACDRLSEGLAALVAADLKRHGPDPDLETLALAAFVRAMEIVAEENGFEDFVRRVKWMLEFWSE